MIIAVLKDFYLFFSYNYEVFGECITTYTFLEDCWFFSYNYEVFDECITKYTFFESIDLLQGGLRFKTFKELGLSLLFRRIIAKNIRVAFNY